MSTRDVRLGKLLVYHAAGTHGPNPKQHAKVLEFCLHGYLVRPTSEAARPWYCPWRDPTQTLSVPQSITSYFMSVQFPPGFGRILAMFLVQYTPSRLYM
jgi:hypothetical protein